MKSDPNPSPDFLTTQRNSELGPSCVHHEASRLQLWGGVECTINRVGDQYMEQLKRTGHLLRVSDLDLFADLGIKALRQPVLWDAVPSLLSEDARWKWAQRWLLRLQELNIRPIVGLLHHGSGPRNTSLLDPGFPRKVAEYAGRVATHFPNVCDYTPVNEPLTTSRFSALYGHWYPHAKDETSFARAFLNQCMAVALSMQEIRRVNPNARLIQTEDLGKVYSAPALAYQAEFENERRWLTFDLLCGRIHPGHRMWHHLRWAGIAEDEMQWFLNHPCPPDVIGVNHYLSGERYLDDDQARYPLETHGGNGRDPYADVLAARVLSDGPAGPSGLMMEAWERYRIPVAITECHNGCTREEQLRWFQEVWQGAMACRQRGAEIIAVTAWSLLGAFDWSHLVREKHDEYEPGVFDIRAAKPRPTALAKLARSFAAESPLTHPLLDVPGWWRRDNRFTYGKIVDSQNIACMPRQSSVNESFPTVRPVLIAGGNGTIEGAFSRICEARGIPYRILSRRLFQVADIRNLTDALDQLQPWAVVNVGGYAGVDEAEFDSHQCFLQNTQIPHLLALECAQRNLPLVSFSSDLVFDGLKNEPYVESDAPGPLCVYGESQVLAEGLILEALPSSLIIRSSAFLDPWDEHNVVTLALRTLASQDELVVAGDVLVSLTYMPDLVNATMDLLIDGERGIWHLANKGQLSWAEIIERCAGLAALPTGSLRVRPLDDLHLAARRPRFSVLSSEKAHLMPTLDQALSRFFRDCEVNLTPLRHQQSLVA